MGEQGTVGRSVTFTLDGKLEQRKSLLVMLKRVQILDSLLKCETEGRQGHHGVIELLNISARSCKVANGYKLPEGMNLLLVQTGFLTAIVGCTMLLEARHVRV